MVRPARVVEHLRLRGESESALRHVLPALEDAFRTASLPDAGARLICVRRLQLGRLPSNGSAQSVALLIEGRFTEAEWKVVHATESGARGAQAVWFRDAFEAHEAAALKIAAGQPLDDWFWPLAVPKIAAVTGGEQLRAIAFAVAVAEEAPAALPAWTTSLVRAGYGAQLIAALRPGDGRALMRSAGVSAVSTAARRELAVTPDDHHDPGSERARTAPAGPQRVSDRGQRNEEFDDRGVFVELMTSRASGGAPQRPAAIAAQPKATGGNTPAAMVHPPHVGARAPRAGGTPQPVARREHGPLQPEAQRETIEHQHIHPPAQRLVGPAEVTGDPTRDDPAEALPSASFRERLRGRPRSSSPDECDMRRERATVDAPLTFESPWLLPGGAPTAAGGLMFLLPVLERVGFAKWAAEHGPEEPEADVLAAEILHLLLSRLLVDGEDPAWALAAAFRLTATKSPTDAFRLKPEVTHSPGEVQLQPEETRELRGRRELRRRRELRGFRLQAEGCEVASIWLNTCRRYLRRHARIGLASLVVRPARLAITPTHVDVFFRLNAADLRIRRAGLDIDPGWVPWFGRVVAFHYGDRTWN